MTAINPVDDPAILDFVQFQLEIQRYLIAMNKLQNQAIHAALVDGGAPTVETMLQATLAIRRRCDSIINACANQLQQDGENEDN